MASKFQVPTWMIEFSGGLDSTYTLYDWLRNENNKKKVILVHHVNLRHQAENRLVYEREAVHNILQWFKQQGLDNFIYHESTFDYGTLPRIKVKDIQITSLFTSIILKTPGWNKINNLILSWHKGEVDSNENMRGHRVMTMLEACEVPRKITIHFPIEFMTRKDMVDDMPAELFALVHSCRKPTEENKVCGKCKTCLEYIREGIQPV
jgi:7-cyano-7-deazaguanine synthase in queuosine biosynthesis